MLRKSISSILIMIHLLTASIAAAQSGGAWVGPGQQIRAGGLDRDNDCIDDQVIVDWSPGSEPNEINEVPGPGCPCEMCRVCIGLGGPRSHSPVILASGNYHYEQTDMVISGRGPDIVVHRVYNSHDMYRGAVGYGWHHSLIIRAIREKYSGGEFITLLDPNGGRPRYTKSGSDYVSPAGHYETVSVAGNQIVITWPDKSLWTFTSDGWIERITDPNGNRLNFEYEGFFETGFRYVKRVVQEGTNRFVNVTWDFPSRRITSIADHTGRSVTYTQDSAEKLTGVTDVGGKSWTYEYQDIGWRPMLNRVAFDGVTYATATYNGSGRVVAYMENGETWTYQYLANAQVAKRDPAGNEWMFTHNGPLGVIASDQDPTGGLVQSSWRGDLLLQQQIDEEGGIWEYDGLGDRIDRMTRRVGEQSWTWNMSYEDPLWQNRPTRIVGPAGWGGNTTLYDAAGNPIEIGRVLSDGVQEETLLTIERNAQGEMTAAQDAAGARTEYVRDMYGNVTTIRLPASNDSGQRPEYTYVPDALGRITSVTDPLGRVTQYEFDNYGRLTKLTLPNPGTGATGFEWRWTYDEKVGEQFKTTVTDPNGAVTQVFEDVWGHTRRIIDAAGNETTIDWDQGMPVEIVDAEGNVTTYSYNSRGLLETVLHPNGRTTNFGYTPTGLLQTRTDRKGQTTTFTYDELGRLKTRQYSDGTVTYTYSGPNLVTVTDTTQPIGQQVTNLTYDSRGRLESTTDPDNNTVAFTWLDGDRLGSYRVNTDSPVSYSYFPSGAVHTIKRDSDPTGFEYTYRQDGLRDTLRYPNNSRVTWEWDALGRLLAKTNINLDASLISRYSYAYDVDHAGGGYGKKGQRTSMIEQLGINSPTEERYYYDVLNQLTRVIYPGGEDHAWTYDSVGNRTSSSITIPGESPVVRNYQYYQNGANGNSQLLQSDGEYTYTWDDNGNLSWKAGGVNDYVDFDWNPRDQLTALTTFTLAATYRYNFSGFRTSKTVDGEITRYVYSPDWHILKETTGSRTADYIFGSAIDEILQIRAPEGDFYYHTDALGSVRQITDTGGATADSYSFGAWGEMRGSTSTLGNTFQYTGREIAEVGFMHYRQRDYAPTAGRFHSEDPIGLLGGDLNSYRYVGGNPTNDSDPMGLAGKPQPLPGVPGAAYRMDLSQVTPNMHIFWRNGDLTVVTMNGGWDPGVHGGVQTVKPPMQYRPQLRDLVKSFLNKPQVRAASKSAHKQKCPTGPQGLKALSMLQFVTGLFDVLDASRKEQEYNVDFWEIMYIQSLGFDYDDEMYNYLHPGA